MTRILSFLRSLALVAALSISRRISGFERISMGWRDPFDAAVPAKAGTQSKR